MSKNGNTASTKARPLTARQIVASTLLGVDPPRLGSRQLVASGELFGLSEGAIRVALTRMVQSGELTTHQGRYALAGPLLTRQARQAEGRRPDLQVWDGRWDLYVVHDGARPASERQQLRAAMRSLRVAERREGVWTRPANLPPARLAEARLVVSEQAQRFTAAPADSAQALAESLWDLGSWSRRATDLRAEMADHEKRLVRGDITQLRGAWELAASVLRHLVADPLLPDELLSPEWPGPALRSDYDAYDRAFKRAWMDAFSAS